MVVVREEDGVGGSEGRERERTNHLIVLTTFKELLLSKKFIKQ